MMRPRTITACLAGLALAVTACSDPAAESSTGDAPASWPDPSADLDGIDLTIWAAQNSNTIPKPVIDAFEQETGASVDIVTIPDPYEQGVQTKVATGDKPDLAFWQPVPSMLRAINARANLQPLDNAPWIDELEPNLQDMTGILDDTRYAALISSPAIEGVYYNKEVFAEHGIRDIPANFDDMVEVGRRLMADGVTPFYEMGGDRWATQWWVQVQLADAAQDGLWDRVNAGDETFEDPTILGAIQTYQELVDEGLFNEDITTATFEDQGEALLTGEAAMVVQVNTFFLQLQAMASTAELNQKIGFFPISPSDHIGTFIPDQANSLVAFRTGDAEREAAARQLLAFWMGPFYEEYVEASEIVSLKPSVKTPDSVPQALLDVHASVADAVGSMQALAVANPDLYIYLADMLNGTMTPEEVATATQQQFEQLAAAAGAEGF